MSLIPRHSLFDLDNFFDNNWPSLPREGNRQGTFAPRVDVRDKADAYEISAELPGVNKEDVEITLQNGVLTIQAESRQEDKEEKNGQVIRQERRYGKFVRSFDLGPQVKDDDINARFENGVLTLTAPKSEPKVPEAKRIEIH